MVTRYIERLEQEPSVISSEILKELSGDSNLPQALNIAFRHDPLYESSPERLHFLFPHFLGDFEENITIHHISGHILNRVVQTPARSGLLAFNKLSLQIGICHVVRNERLTVHGIYYLDSVVRGYLLPVQDEGDVVRLLSTQLPRVDSGPRRYLRHSSFKGECQHLSIC